MELVPLVLVRGQCDQVLVQVQILQAQTLPLVEADPGHLVVALTVAIENRKQ